MHEENNNNIIAPPKRIKMWVFSPLSPWQRIRSFDASSSGTTDVIRVHKASNVVSILCPKGVSKGFSPIEVLLKWKCPLVYLQSIYTVSTLHQTICFHHIAPPHKTRAQTQTPHNCWKLSSVPSLPRQAQCPQAEALLSEGMCPELIDILGNTIVKY